MPIDADGTSREMIQSAQRGDRRAFEELLARQLPALRAFVRLRAGGSVRAHESNSDLVQSVCREVLADLDRFEYRGEVAFRHWLYAAALRKIVDRHRFHHAAKRDAGREIALRRDSSAGDAHLLACYSRIASPSQDAIANEEVERIEAAFDELPEDYRQVITLARIVGLPHADIAREMNRTEDSVRNLLGRALSRLAAMLRQNEA